MQLPYNVSLCDISYPAGSGLAKLQARLLVPVVPGIELITLKNAEPKESSRYVMSFESRMLSVPSPEKQIGIIAQGDVDSICRYQDDIIAGKALACNDERTARALANSDRPTAAVSLPFSLNACLGDYDDPEDIASHRACDLLMKCRGAISDFASIVSNGEGTGFHTITCVVGFSSIRDAILAEAFLERGNFWTVEIRRVWEQSATKAA